MLNLLLADTANPGSSWWIYVVLIVLVIAMLVLPTISNNKQKKAFNNMVENLHVGDEIRTIGGIIGKVTKINRKGDTQTFLLETGAKGSKTIMEFDIASIGVVLKSIVAKTDDKKDEVKVEDASKTTADTEVKSEDTAIAKVEDKPAETAQVDNKIVVENVKEAKKEDKKVKTSKSKK
ncbi:MAG: preprotein translocase subunit YajC [Clostridia bacterium]